MSEVPSLVVNASHNPYDRLAKVETSGLHVEEKQTVMEPLGLKERLGQAGISMPRVDGDHVLADCLMKSWGLRRLRVYEQLLRS